MKQEDKKNLERNLTQSQLFAAQVEELNERENERRRSLYEMALVAGSAVLGIAGGYGLFELGKYLMQSYSK